MKKFHLVLMILIVLALNNIIFYYLFVENKNPSILASPRPILSEIQKTMSSIPQLSTPKTQVDSKVSLSNVASEQSLKIENSTLSSSVPESTQTLVNQMNALIETGALSEILDRKDKRRQEIAKELQEASIEELLAFLKGGDWQIKNIALNQLTYSRIKELDIETLEFLYGLSVENRRRDHILDHIYGKDSERGFEMIQEILKNEKRWLNSKLIKKLIEKDMSYVKSLTQEFEVNDPRLASLVQGLIESNERDFITDFIAENIDSLVSDSVDINFLNKLTYYKPKDFKPGDLNKILSRFDKVNDKYGRSSLLHLSRHLTEINILRNIQDSLKKDEIENYTKAILANKNLEPIQKRSLLESHKNEIKNTYLLQKLKKLYE